jgi:hypothetical protein
LEAQKDMVSREKLCSKFARERRNSNMLALATGRQREKSPQEFMSMHSCGLQT